MGTLVRTLGALLALVAYAVPVAAEPVSWQMGLQPAASELMTETTEFHTMMLVIITAIVAFVLLLLLWVMVRYNARMNPTASRTTHNTLVEVVWTVVPVMILVVIAIPSFRLLYHHDVIPPADLTIKAIGRQWFWSYEYPDNGEFTFDALMKNDDELAAGEPRLLATDNHVVVPVGKVVRVLVTASDVIHSFALPPFGVKTDGVPGRINETWFKAEREGIYYGQCSELCGARHAFMPITLEVVSEARFAEWVEEAKQKFARADGAVEVAANAPSTGQ